MVFNLLLGNPYPWLFAAAFFTGAAVSRITRGTHRAKDPEKARERKGFIAAAALALAAVFFLCAVFIPGPEQLRAPAVWIFFLIAAAAFFLAFRFKKAAGLPLLLLAGALAVAIALFFQAVTAFTGETEIARIKILDTANNAMKFELSEPAGRTATVDMPGTMLGAEVKELIFHDAFVFLGAKTAYRFVGLKSAGRRAGTEMTQELRAYELAKPAGISESIYRFVEENPSLAPFVKTAQVQITYVAVKPGAEYSLRVQHDSGVEIMRAAFNEK